MGKTRKTIVYHICSCCGKIKPSDKMTVERRLGDSEPRWFCKLCEKDMREEGGLKDEN